MKRTKVLSKLIAGVMSISCLTVDVFAAANADDYDSFAADLSVEYAEKWEERVLDYIEDNVDVQTISFSEAYCSYDFYSLERDDNAYFKIIFENDEIIAISYTYFTDDGVPVFQYEEGSYEYLAEALENNGKILFGHAIVNAFPCGLIYADGVLYNYNSIAAEIGETDLVFGEIPYSEPYWTDTPDDAVGALLPETALTTTTTASAAEPADIIPGLPGDVNLDGRTSLADAVHINRIISGIVNASEQQIKLADCYADGVVDAMDVTIIVDYMVEAIDSLPYIPE